MFNLAGQPALAPLWLACLWPVFATTLMHSFAVLQNRLLLAAVCGALGGALSYIAGVRLSAMEFASPLWGPVLLGALWAAVFPLLLQVAARLRSPARCAAGVDAPRCGERSTDAALTAAMKNPVIYWFRQDLRLRDLPGLSAALATGRPVLACYILDDESPGQWRMGGASRWWLHHSLAALAEARSKRAVASCTWRAVAPTAFLRDLAERSGADLVCCSRQYEPWARQLEVELHAALATAWASS